VNQYRTHRRNHSVIRLLSLLLCIVTALLTLGYHSVVIPPQPILHRRHLALSVAALVLVQSSVCPIFRTTHSLTGTFDRGHGSQRPPRLAVLCDPPGVVGTGVVLDLLHPRSAGSSTLALPLQPDVRFTACTSVHSQA